MTARPLAAAQPRAAHAAPTDRPPRPSTSPAELPATAGRRGSAPGATAAWILFLVLASALPGCGGAGPDGHDSGTEARHEGHGDEDHHDEGHGDEHDDHHDEASGVVELTPEAEERIGLTTEPAATTSVDQRRTTTGTLGYDEDLLAHVGSRVGGRLVQVAAELGEDVTDGETLAVVDSVEVGEAKAAYLRARARWEVAQERYERQRSLYEDGIIAEDVLLEAEGRHREAAAELAASRETLGLLGLSNDQVSRLSWGRSDVSRVPVRAPFDGRVVARHATRGELVTPDDRLFTVADLSGVWLWVDLYERDLAHVRRGEQVEVRLDAFPGQAFTGELAYIADEVDPHSRTARARVDLPNGDRRLKPGMFARVALTGLEEESAETALTVPRAALQRHDGGQAVFVRTGPGHYERRAVQVGRLTAERAEILAGLDTGDEVVVEGAFLLHSQSSADQLGGHHH